MAKQCRRWNLSPNEWYEQPAGLLDRMDAMLSVYDAHSAWYNRRGKMADFIKANPGILDVVTDIRKLEQALKESNADQH